ncbi:MAE_28990/MAE_18760 family HEPN-like nuclease [Clostridioides difficile]
MSTFIYDLVDSVEDRWKEVDLLISNASEQYHKNTDLYDAICRATIVLIVAHFEGFIKASLKSVIDDINRFGSFAEIPDSMKRICCSKYLDISDNSNKNRLESLIETFDKLNMKLNVEPFLFENNKNPSPSIIDKIFKKFGIKNFLGMIETSDLGNVFENEKSQNYELLDKARAVLREGILEYPYKLDLGKLNIDISKKKTRESGLWSTFLDELLRVRNGIAHGTDLNNLLSLDDIKEMRFKVELIQCSFTIVLCNASIKNYKV